MSWEAALDSTGYWENATYHSSVEKLEVSEITKKVFYQIQNENTNKRDLINILTKIGGSALDSLLGFVYVDDSTGDTSLIYSINPIESNSNEKIFLLVIGNECGMTWESVFFLLREHGEKYFSIGPFRNFHRYGFSFESFINEKGKTIFYIKENFGSGSGIWQFNYFFYMIDGLEIKPVLNILKRGNLTWPTPVWFWYESEIISTNPLTFKAVFNNEILTHADSTGCKLNSAKLVNDSTIIACNWNDVKNVYEPQFDEKMNEHKIKSYYLNYNLNLFIKAHSAEIKNNLNSDSTQCVTSQFLTEVIDRKKNEK